MEIPSEYCQCGCGQKTNIYRGKPRKTVKGHTTPEKKERIRQLWLGRNMPEESRQKMRLAHLGKKWSEHQRQVMSERFSGDRHWNWQGGIWEKNKSIRRSYKHRAWREQVLKRDGYCCVVCKENRKELLQADHLRSFALFPKLRFDLANGRTLCLACHRKTENFGRKSVRGGAFA